MGAGDIVILDAIPFEADVERLLARLHLRGDGPHAERVRSMAVEAQAVARPKGLYRPAYVEDRGEDWVVVDGIRLASRILRVNLEDTYRVFPYVATCGRELAEWAAGSDDLLERYWADAINEMALRAALKALLEDMDRRFGLGRMSAMNPGSLEDWPLTEQRQLFALLGSPSDAVGVELTESCLMLPVKSVSGLRFPSETSYENCQLCPRDRCPGRRAPYDPELYDRRYGSTVP
jgi:hypothetical protein